MLVVRAWLQHCDVVIECRDEWRDSDGAFCSDLLASTRRCLSDTELRSSGDSVRLVCAALTEVVDQGVLFDDSPEGGLSTLA